MKKIIMLLMMISLAVITVACGNDDATKKNNTEEAASDETSQETGQNSVSEDELVAEDKTVATINGEEINGSAYNRVYRLVKSSLQQQGQDVKDTEKVKDQTLNELITQELIMQDAEKQGLSASQEEIDSKIAALKEQHGDQFASTLKKNGFTEETYKAQLKQNLVANKYMESVLGIKVTEKEIKEYYDSAKEKSEKELPPLEQVKDQIKQTLTAQKQQEKQKEIQSKIDELKKNAEIEKLI
ncbi:SurA N-terminal domain-containing protein [Gracilibacillus sp. D59]|uniref:SurA N-terminal domain-containing protein n=1 Tax=Gracilibacillus sp. D59 TaxID=3457434 RepID=UPI003FCC6464